MCLKNKYTHHYTRDPQIIYTSKEMLLKPPNYLSERLVKQFYKNTTQTHPRQINKIVTNV